MRCSSSKPSARRWPWERPGTAEVVVDRLVLDEKSLGRLTASLEEAWGRGGGVAALWVDGARTVLRRGLACPDCGRGFEEPSAGLFSYQSAVGACPACRGFGRTLGIDWGKVIPDDSLSLLDGAMRPWNGRSSEWERQMLQRFAGKRRIPLDVPWRGCRGAARGGARRRGDVAGGQVPGVRAWFEWLETRTYKMHVRVLLARYREYALCTRAGVAPQRDRARLPSGGHEPGRVARADRAPRPRSALDASPPQRPPRASASSSSSRRASATSTRSASDTSRSTGRPARCRAVKRSAPDSRLRSARR